MNKTNSKILKSLPILILFIIAIIGGYFVGNLVIAKNFVAESINNENIESLRDDISLISIANKTPDQFDGAIAFQIAEKVLRESTVYEVLGDGIIETSLGVTQTSKTIDRRNGDELYIGFTTYSSFVKTSRQSHFKIGGDINLQYGSPSDPSVENASWSKKYDHYTWESYYETFGKHANVNCSYIVSTKTVTSDSGFTKDGDYYSCTLELDPILGSRAYVKQVGANTGIAPANIIVHKIQFTFWLDENFRYIKQEKFESYTVPYYGINMTLDASVNVSYTY